MLFGALQSQNLWLVPTNEFKRKFLCCLKVFSRSVYQDLFESSNKVSKNSYLKQNVPHYKPDVFFVTISFAAMLMILISDSALSKSAFLQF